jgi:hypothetical protein
MLLSAVDLRLRGNPEYDGLSRLRGAICGAVAPSRDIASARASGMRREKRRSHFMEG